MKPLLAIAVASLLVFGCTGGAKTANNSQVQDDGKFEVALLTPGSISDAGWNAMAYEGLTAIHDELGATVENKEATDAQIKDSMRSYAQKDFELVIGHGFEYNAPAMEVAKDFPNTVFVSSSGSQTAKNVGAFRFYLEQGFYLAGYMAASMSKTHTIAAIGYNKIPSIKSTFRGFEAGAKAADPNVNVIEPDMDDNADVAAMKQATLAAIAQGADFVIHQANDKAQGVFDACKEKGAYAFGANLNQNDNPSGIVIASAYIIAKPAYVELAKEVKAGTYTGRVDLRGMADGAIGFEINPKMITKIPMSLLASLVKLQQDIASGALKVPKDEF
ncbi:MAG TPA: BMP family protein [Fimbriimonadaceae bacterium]|nr:BMP family protein [Fimbriimonadaceae bacterium]